MVFLFCFSKESELDPARPSPVVARETVLEEIAARWLSDLDIVVLGLLSLDGLVLAVEGATLGLCVRDRDRLVHLRLGAGPVDNLARSWS